MIPHKHFVYLIQAGATNNYKIGVSHNPQKRLLTLQTSHYEQLKILIATSFNNRFIALAVEDELHYKYREFNTVGEWFKFDIATLSEVKHTLKNYRVTEILELKAINKELQLQNQQLRREINELLQQQPKSHVAPTTQKYKPPTKKEILKKLFNSVERVGDKLTPKSKVIDMTKRADAEIMSKVYKDLKDIGAIELRGNKGYHALMTYTEVKNKLGEQNDN